VETAPGNESMNEPAFLSAICDTPSDESTWLALADWLDENGQPQRAELIRLTRRMLRTPAAERGAMPERYAALLGAGVKPVVVEWTNSIGMRFALVPGGRFLMGSPEGELGRTDDERLHEVELTRPYWLGVLPVTQAQWKEVMGDNPAWFSVGGKGKDDVARLDADHFPIESVSWEDAQAFLGRLTARAEEEKAGWAYRLPTEAEWEHACRAGADVKHPFCLALPSLSLSSTQANFDGNYPYGGAPKGPYLERPSAAGGHEVNPFGLCDMHGNVWEWCSDWFGEYPAQLANDPLGPAGGSGRVLRGGGWLSVGRDCRAAERLDELPSDRSFYQGFRVAAHRRARTV
jgi:uncharacterized protein (TIGR02996 family)